jgi:hypothetical protein
MSPLVGSQGQADAIYFDLSNALYQVSHSLLLHKLCAFGLSGGSENWFHSHPSNRKFQIPLTSVLPSRFEVLFPVFLRDQSWDSSSSMCLITNQVTQLHLLLLTISESTEPSNLLRSLTLTLYKVCKLLIICNSTSVKLKLYPSPR